MAGFLLGLPRGELRCLFLGCGLTSEALLEVVLSLSCRKICTWLSMTTKQSHS